MLDLNAGIDLDEIPFPRIHVIQKLDGSSIAIVCFARQPHRRVAYFAADIRGEIRGGSDLHYFLVATLHGAVALVKMQQVTMMIGENLDFQVPGMRQIFFQENRCISEAGARFTLGFFQEGIELGGVMNDAHAAAAAAHRRLHNDRKGNLPGNFVRLGSRLHRILRSGQNRNPR